MVMRHLSGIGQGMANATTWARTRRDPATAAPRFRASASRTALAGGGGRPSPGIVASYDGPMRMLRHLCVLAWLPSLAACAPPSSPPASSRPAAAPRSLLLVSLDGVHPDDLARGDTPHLERL